MNRVRLSQLERGIRRPSSTERSGLFNLLQVHPRTRCSLRPDRMLRSLINLGKRAVPAPPVYLPPRDRPARVRYLAAYRQWPELVHALTERVKLRSDYDIVQHFCHILPIDSADECLYIIWRLALGAKPALIAPASLGWTPNPILCPMTKNHVGHRPRPCLTENDRIEFPQVSFRTPKVYRVDFLVWAARWSALEIDGPGHHDATDRERDHALALTTLRLTRPELVRRASESPSYQKAG